MAQPREQWASRFGFIMAAVGSAVGLGNMWRFSYLTAENGGAAFVVLYLLMTAFIGLPVMLAELTVGRGARRSPIGALQHFGGERWRPLGALFVAAGFLILAYYSVIAGWTVRYALIGLIDGFAGDAGERFGAIATGPRAVLWHLLFMGATVGVVMAGVRGGIERVALVLMPLLFVILVGLAVYAATLPGAAAGYRYYLEFELAGIWDTAVLAEAAGQAFFSLSLGMGAMLTFASYLPRESHLPNESLVIAGADFGVAFVAGLVVFPVLFALGLQQQVSGSTVGALFITLPTAFAEMGPGGRVVGAFFFTALVVGALTSAISLLEVVVSSLIDDLGWERHHAAFLIGVSIALLGIPAALDTDVLGAMDALAGQFFLMLGGLGLALFVGWRMADPEGEVSAGAEGVRWFFLWRWLLRLVVPGFLLFVLWSMRESLAAAVTGLAGGGLE
jgi:NSS family neurotransmitter:Na+ symporter